MINTKTGVREFTIPVMALSNCVCATEKSMAGIKLPRKPDMKMSGKCFLFICFNQETAKGIIKREADSILIDATCKAGKTVRPFLMRIKELPQTMASKMSNAQESKRG